MNAPYPPESLTVESASAKSKRSLRPLRVLLPFAFEQKGRILCALIALIVASCATLALPIAVREVIDRGFDQAHPDVINTYFMGLIGLVGVLALASSSRYYLVMSLGARIAAQVREAVFSHLTTLDVTFFDTIKSGSIVSRLTNDTELVRAVFGPTASIALRNGVMFLGAIAMMIYTSAWLSMMVLGVIPLIVVPLVLSGRAVRSRSEAAQQRLAETSAFAVEAVGSARIMHAYGMENATAKTFKQVSREALEAARQSLASRAVLTCGIIFFVSASVVGVLWYGAGQVVKGQISAGYLSQFILYAIFAASGLGQLSEVYGEVQQAAGAASRLAQWLNLKPEIAAPQNPTPLPSPVQGRLEFANVSFRYPTRPDTSALHEVNLHINAGERIALVGASGAGKSTILQLICRFYDPEAGTIRLDGIDLRQLDPAVLRRAIAFVPQDPVIFGMSVRENIAYGSPDASDAAIQKAAALAAADAFIRALPHGYDTPMGERGVTLSGGQRQRIALARAILKNAPILVLDEATSALDAESELAVQKALDEISQQRTTIVIAHRLATVLKADRILVMNNGRIAEEGTHTQLMARQGPYARLAQLQFIDQVF
jgi:ATP-binding cassette, subfamily B, bacterial